MRSEFIEAATRARRDGGGRRSTASASQVTKPMVATLILQLQDEGRLSLTMRSPASCWLL